MRQKSNALCKATAKPSSTDARVLSQLFPSSSSRPMKRSSQKAFDPSAECVAYQQQKKKKAFKSKPSNVIVILVSDPSVVPRGKSRKKLEHDERVKKIEFRREMLSFEVKNLVLRGFKHIENLVGFTLLEADQGGKLHPSGNQAPNGEYIIVDARRKNGPIYIHPTLVSNYDVVRKAPFYAFGCKSE